MVSGKSSNIALKKLASLLGKMFSYGDRIVIINLVLLSLPVFMLSFLELPKAVRKRLDFYRSQFFLSIDVLD